MDLTLIKATVGAHIDCVEHPPHLLVEAEVAQQVAKFTFVDRKERTRLRIYIRIMPYIRNGRTLGMMKIMLRTP